MKAVLGAILLSCLVVGGSAGPALGAHLVATVNPNTDTSEFRMTYQRTVFIEYPGGSGLADYMRGQEWNVVIQASSHNPGVQALTQSINEKIRADESIASVNIDNMEYTFQLTGRDINTSFDLKLVLEGSLTDYVITRDQIRTLVDLGWRGMSTNSSIVVDGVDVNIPIRVLESQDPVLYDIVRGGEPGAILSMPLINADFIQKQPLSNWHFLFDPTGITVDGSQFIMSEELAGVVFSSWTMGESSIREGIQVEREWEASVDGIDHPTLGSVSYDIRAVQSPDLGNLHLVGFGVADTLDGVEMAGVTPDAPEGFGQTSTGDFPVMIIYGMAGLAAVGGVLFFVVSNRALKNEKQGQQGIDPSRLVGYETSSAAGGYRTNRGEAQLRDDADYQKSRSYYDEIEPEKPVSPPVSDATCSCADSLGMNSECDCQMQGSCLCDATCNCTTSVCKEHTDPMR